MLKCCVLYGGPSAEHEVSCLSAATICREFKRQPIELVPIGISKAGEWFLQPDATEDNNRLVVRPDASRRVHINPSHGLRTERAAIEIDVAFPMIHGNFGEDGSLQAILEHCGIAYVGSDKIASAIGMHKLLSKMIWANHGLPIVDYFFCLVPPDGNPPFTAELTAFVQRCGYPLFVKPCRGGSSVGVHKVHNRTELDAALRSASRFDRHLLCERAIIGREIEFAVLDTRDGDTQVSAAGEIVAQGAFYDYDTKYIHTQHATLIAPAEIDRRLAANMQKTVKQAYQIVGCRDLARVDLLLDNDNRYYLNEINTLPGFTDQSMFPMLWSVSGYTLSAVLSLLIERAVNRHRSNE